MGCKYFVDDEWWLWKLCCGESPPRAIGSKRQYILGDFHQWEKAQKCQYEPFPMVWRAFSKDEVVLVQVVAWWIDRVSMLWWCFLHRCQTRTVSRACPFATLAASLARDFAVSFTFLPAFHHRHSCSCKITNSPLSPCPIWPWPICHALPRKTALAARQDNSVRRD